MAFMAGFEASAKGIHAGTYDEVLRRPRRQELDAALDGGAASTKHVPAARDEKAESILELIKLPMSRLMLNTASGSAFGL